MYRASFALVASLAIRASASAQEPMRAGSPLIPHVTASGAFDLRNGQTGHPPMYLGVASLEWPTRISGLGVRLDAVYAKRKPDIRVHPDECGASCNPGIGTTSVYSSRVTGQGAFAGATYDLVRHGAFRPYLTGGVGAVQTHHKFIIGTSWVCRAEICALANGASPLRFGDDRPVSGAATIGLGAVYTWRWVSVVGAARYYAVNNGITRGLNGGFPVSLGLRF